MRAAAHNRDQAQVNAKGRSERQAKYARVRGEVRRSYTCQAMQSPQNQLHVAPLYLASSESRVPIKPEPSIVANARPFWTGTDRSAQSNPCATLQFFKACRQRNGCRGASVPPLSLAPRRGLYPGHHAHFIATRPPRLARGYLRNSVYRPAGASSVPRIR